MEGTVKVSSVRVEGKESSGRFPKPLAETEAVYGIADLCLIGKLEMEHKGMETPNGGSVSGENCTFRVVGAGR